MVAACDAWDGYRCVCEGWWQFEDGFDGEEGCCIDVVDCYAMEVGVTRIDGDSGGFAGGVVVYIVQLFEFV